MKTSHTTGPWSAETKGSRFFIDGEDGLTVAFVDRAGVRERAEIEANARLIAAAPELLTMLERLYDATYGKTDLVCNLDFEHARAAIAKARGLATPATA